MAPVGVLLQLEGLRDMLAESPADRNRSESESERERACVLGNPGP